MKRRKQDPLDRLLDKTEHDPETGCLVFTAGKTKTGYGKFHLNGAMHAHRAHWLLTNGPVPVGMEVRHICPHGHNKACVNLEHLALGTHQQNMIDRSLSGAKAVKLTKTQALQIRYLRLAGWKLRDLADRYGINITTVHKIVHGKIWTLEEAA